MHLSLLTKSSFYLPAFEISRSCRTAFNYNFKQIQYIPCLHWGERVGLLLGVALYIVQDGVYLSQGLTIRGNNIYLQWPNVSKLLSNIQLAILSILPAISELLKTFSLELLAQSLSSLSSFLRTSSHSQLVASYLWVFLRAVTSHIFRCPPQCWNFRTIYWG
jgi:hypothetical protein